MRMKITTTEQALEIQLIEIRLIQVTKLFNTGRNPGTIYVSFAKELIVTVAALEVSDEEVWWKMTAEIAWRFEDYLKSQNHYGWNLLAYAQTCFYPPNDMTPIEELF